MYSNIRTEYTFGAVFGPIKSIIQKAKDNKAKAVGIADLNGTWGHTQWEKICKAEGIKPVYGIRIAVCEDVALKERRQAYDIMSFIALNNDGLKQIYKLIELAYSQHYFKPLIQYTQINTLNEKDIAIIGTYSPRFDLLERHIYLELSPSTPIATRNLSGVDYIASPDNWYINADDKIVYEPFADERKRETRTSHMHILTHKEWNELYPNMKQAMVNNKSLLKRANATLNRADMVKYRKKEDITKLCKEGAKEKGINLKDPVYKKRLKRELKLIKEKDYVDYFLVVADVIRYAKSKMLVGHSRGSSAGSLVCYLLSITEIDPIPYGLVFERFIDVNRLDLPDIDIDFQDTKRHLVLRYLQDTYGKENVAQIGNINRLKPRSAISRFAKAMQIPSWEVDEVKDAIVEKSSGDARAAFCIEDTFDQSDIGKSFIKEYPNMKAVSRIEGHASHTGVHAAGIIVCNKPITDYCGINPWKDQCVAMIDKRDAELVNLLKIDALGLRTLSIIADTCDLIGMPYNDLYTLDLEDKKTYKVFQKNRLAAIFQFEGDAVKSLAKQMPIENIMDISALSALGRPGPLATGGAMSFVNRRAGKEEIKYMVDNEYVINEIKETYGIIIYQEQVMNIGRNYGGLSWEDVSELRKAMSKSLGDEFFGKYKAKFLKGAIEKGSSEKDATKVWDQMNSMGSWSFNKSHAVSYGMITYICAYLKAHHPLEFAMSALNHTKDDKDAIKLLRDLRENEGIKHKDISIKHSKKEWSVRKGKLLGGLLTLDGLGPAKANQVINNRIANKPNPPGISKILSEKRSPFKYIYPARQIYGDYYLNPQRYGVDSMPVSPIINMTQKKDYCAIGRLSKTSLRDANEDILIFRRGGQRLDPPTTYINLQFEDDTESVRATIGRHEYEDYGKEIAEKGKIDKDWYLFWGSYNPDWGSIYIKEIIRITKEE